MKTHYAEASDEVVSSRDTADDHVWREHKIDKPRLYGDAVIAVLAVVMLMLSGLHWGSRTQLPADRLARSASSRPTGFRRHAARPGHRGKIADFCR
jgi:hypothetical protein